jgi:serine/threonine protein phosphatase PrpC
LLKKILSIFRSKKTEDLTQDSDNEPTSEIPTTPLKTIPLKDEPKEAEDNAKVSLELPQFIVGCAQSIGKIRDHNEDSILAMTALAANNGESFPIGLFIVADGMGGHKQGEIASNIAVRIVAREIFQRVISGLLDVQPSPPEEGIQEIMETSVLEAHNIITKEAPGSGTTLTAALIMGKQMSIAHVGDSRAYTVNLNGEVTILTRDHSLVKRMIELGHLSEEEASVHPQRNVLYRALGQGEPFSPDVSTTQTPLSGYLLLCSDGLWGLVTKNEMVRLILSAPSPETAAQMLVDSANQAGGPDNISAILVKLPDYPG